MSVVSSIPVSFVLLDYKCRKCIMEIFVPSSYIHIISSTVTTVSIFSTVVSIVTITIITVYSNNI